MLKDSKFSAVFFVFSESDKIKVWISEVNKL